MVLALTLAGWWGPEDPDVASGLFVGALGPALGIWLIHRCDVRDKAAEARVVERLTAERHAEVLGAIHSLRKPSETD